MAEKKFGGREFRASPLLATEGIAMQVRLGKMMGGAMKRLPAILAARGTDDAASNGEAIAAFMDIVQGVEPQDVVRLVSDVLARVELKRPSGDWDAPDMDADFADDPGQLYAVTFWALQAQVGPFFAGLLALGGQKTGVKA